MIDTEGKDGNVELRGNKISRAFFADDPAEKLMRQKAFYTARTSVSNHQLANLSPKFGPRPERCPRDWQPKGTMIPSDHGIRLRARRGMATSCLPVGEGGRGMGYAVRPHVSPKGKAER